MILTHTNALEKREDLNLSDFKLNYFLARFLQQVLAAHSQNMKRFLKYFIIIAGLQSNLAKSSCR
jgi:hypothetical protein